MLSTAILLSGCGINVQNADKSGKADTQSTASPKKESESSEASNLKIPKDAKIVAGTVMASELLDLLDIELVGVPSTKKGLPERYNGLTEIGMSMKPDIEKIVSLGTNVLVTDSTLKESLDVQLKGKDIDIIYMNNNSYEDLIKTIESLGKAFEKEDKAEKVIKDMKQKEEQIMKKIEGKKSPKVMVIFGTTESFMLATKDSFVGSLVEKLGATNITEEIDQKGTTPYVPFSLEQVAKLDPDMILCLTHMEVEASKAAFDKEFSKGLWKNMHVIKNNKVYSLDPEYFGVTANSRASESLERLADILYK
ncbi:putative ABC transporter periplasmic binding protein [Gottschalkia acidurici 9a]|uniref:ABC transporter periplasmic binding protein n=1 Tax=Gottschalkia acidurici (strain ATCC 7906 / DSM 604 / BCRC 14475 / CIP 104303 / KCTC 5404 / NCIMB 10678 / 9a) TaxID=1128398 RepID=K0AW28_GOTA9|nr:ABC transporter substrate-binding protein [Gottschalkia acidurici]AFS77444.1 putative ABC transporter periplasmic binding protein [Gottschalkia acidurici 9a]